MILISRVQVHSGRLCLAPVVDFQSVRSEPGHWTVLSWQALERRRRELSVRNWCTPGARSRGLLGARTCDVWRSKINERDKWRAQDPVPGVDDRASKTSTFDP